MNENGAPVVIIGAGLAGLRCAQELHDAGVAAAVVEASDRIGGRVTSDDINGYTVDRGFQVFLNSYPENSCFDMSALELGKFYSGALSYDGTRLRKVASPFRHLGDSLASLGDSPFSFRDAFAVIRMFLSPSSRGRSSTRQLLDSLGVSDEAREGFFRPFFSGVLLDTELETSPEFFLFLLRMFADGAATLPARGMRALPEQLAAGLPDGSVRTGTPVRSVASRKVELEDGTALDASAVVLATDFTAAASILGRPEPTTWRGTSTLWFAADSAPVDEPILVINGRGQGPVNTLCCHTLTAPSYAPAGKHLICASIVGPDAELDEGHLIDASRGQVSDWFAESSVVAESIASWEHIHTSRVRHSLPRTFGKDADGLTAAATEQGVFLCGDYTETPSINGALASGRIAAERVLQNAR